MKITLSRIGRAASCVLLTALVLAAAAPNVRAQYECVLAEGAAASGQGSLTAADPVQAGRVVRDRRPSSCTGKTNALQNSDPVFYDAHNYVNPTGQDACVVVDFNALGCAGAEAGVVAYSNYNPASPSSNIIGDLGFSTSGRGAFSFPVAAGAAFTIVVYDLVETPNAFCPNYSFTVSYNTNCRQAGFERSNDRKADITVWRPSNGVWYTANSAGGFNFFQFGKAGDLITPGDYAGDNQSDYSVYRPSENIWYYTSGADFAGARFGSPGDVTAPGDYDRDGRQDIAVWRPAGGNWFILQSSTNTVRVVQWGRDGDTPVWGDYDGDLAADFGIVRTGEQPSAPNQLTWYVLLSGSSFVSPPSFIAVNWGLAGDKLVPGDYDGDAKADVAIWRPSEGNWYYIRSRDGAFGGIGWGTAGDIPQPADYDGDLIMDFAVYRPSADPNQNFWFVRNSSNGTTSVLEWGEPNDQPASAPYRIQ